MKKHMKSIALSMSLLFLTGIVAGCSNEDSKNNKTNNSTKISTSDSSTEFKNTSYFTSVDWLKENLNSKDILVLDARGPEAYSKGHIPGAIAVDWKQFSNMEGTSADKGWGEVLSPDKLSRKLSELGIDDSKTIVVYCDPTNGWGDDGRIVWMLQKAGLHNSKILNGGIKKWSELAYDTTKDVTEIVPTNFSIEKFDESTTITTDELKTNLDKLVILDSREKSEYEGATKYGEVRGGHIPGAINLPFNELLSKDGTFKSPSEIQKILDEKGIKKGDSIVTYCTAGIRSGHLAIVLNMMGYENVKNYDASFYAWAADKSLEVQQ